MSFSGTTLSQIWGDLHEYISDKIVLADLIYKNHPFLSKVARDTGFVGDFYPLPMRISTSAGGSANFGNAFNNQSASSIVKVQVPAAQYYQLATITTMAQEATRDRAGAYMKAVTIEMDGAMEAIANTLAQQIFGAGNGIMGFINAAGFNGGGLTLSQPSSGINFFLNQVLNAFSPAGVQRAFIGLVTASDPNLGTVQVAAASSSPLAVGSSDWVAGDSLSLQGNYDQVMQGLAGWFPQGNLRPVVGGTRAQNILFNVDRSVQPQMLAGTYVNGVGQKVEEAIITGLAQVYNFGGRPDQIWVTPQTFSYLQKTMQSKHIMVNDVTDWDVSVTGIRFQSITGEVTIYADPYCTPKTAYLLQSDTVKLVSYGEVPKLLTVNGGNTSLTLQNQAAEQIRLAAFPNLVCTAPGRNGVVSLSV